VPAVPRAAGLLFFAFAGYARIATLGEEVRDPARTIPRAVQVALGVVVVVYAVVGVAALRALGPDRLAGAEAPLAEVASAAGGGPLLLAATGGAVVAAGSVLVSVLVGVSRTGLALARHGDLPGALATLGRRGTPWRADLAGGAAAAVLVLLLARPGAAIALSAFCVLLYYAVANAAALRLGRHERRWPRAVPVLGLVGCLVLASGLPVRAVLAGTLAVALGVGLAVLGGRRSARRRDGPVGGPR